MMSRETRVRKNIQRQPRVGMTMRPVRAARTPPTGTPDIMIVATVARHRGATRPATSAFELGSSPPRPTPARKRRMPKRMGLSTAPQRALRQVKRIVQTMTVRFWPKRSPRRPPARAPIIIPTNAREPSVPIDAFVSPHPVVSMSEVWTVPKTMRS
ncbi:Uncharacterised protein [Mycobacteroides abscessus subsp. abscessus]|nr:Uncharacterised protein [Mycobacteroides abscessus subsp. abscessus]